MTAGRWFAVAALAGLLGGATAPRAHAQDTLPPVIHINPDAKAPDSLAASVPAEILLEALGAYNDSATTRIVGGFTLPAASQLTGPLSVFRGTIRVLGRLHGRVTVINGDLIVEPGALVEGDVLVVGGRVFVRPGGQLVGRQRSYPVQVQVLRTGAGTLIVRPPARAISELAAARASFQTGHFRTTLSVETNRTYNRVEGLPIVFGPTVIREGLRNVEGQLDLRGILWTAPDRTDRRADFGYSARLEFRFGESRRLTVGGQVFRLISPIEEQPLSRTEAGWSAALFQRDYRDYFQSEGTSGYLSYRLWRGLTLRTSLSYAQEKSVSAGDPISILRNDAWRPNPPVDDGHYTTWRVGADYDTRNEVESPSSGWWVRGWWERIHSNDAAPLSLPPEVRDPILPGRYGMSRLGLDARRYARITPSLRAALRVQAGGWLNGDPLPVQRRYALGGPDLLPGYGFRSMSCAPISLADPAKPAVCDRYIAIQFEARTRTRMGLPIPDPDPYITGLQRLFGIREPDVVIFGDAGKSWITGDGPGRVPNNRIPVLREWQYDLGFGIDAGGLGLYLAQPLTGSQPLRFTIRLQRRF